MPPKKGLPKIITKAFTTLANQVTIMEVLGNGEASRPKIISTVEVATTGKKCKIKFKHNEAWLRMRRNHPTIVNCTKAKEN